MFEDTIKAVVDSYKAFTVTRCCSFGAVSNDGTKNQHGTGRVCHAQLQHYDADVYDQIISSYPAKDDLDLKFFDFMKNILYKQWSDFFHLEQTKDGKYYIRISNLSEIPANVVSNFCICSRTIVERKETLLVWDKITEKGFHPSFAYAICRASIDVEDPNFEDLEIHNIGTQLHHSPIDHTASLKRLVVTGPLGCTASFKENPEASFPTNEIWGETKDLRALKGTSIRKFWEKWEKEA